MAVLAWYGTISEWFGSNNTGSLLLAIKILFTGKAKNELKHSGRNLREQCPQELVDSNSPLSNEMNFTKKKMGQKLVLMERPGWPCACRMPRRWVGGVLPGRALEGWRHGQEGSGPGGDCQMGSQAGYCGVVSLAWGEAKNREMMIIHRIGMVL